MKDSKENKQIFSRAKLAIQKVSYNILRCSVLNIEMTHNASEICLHKRLPC